MARRAKTRSRGGHDNRPWPESMEVKIEPGGVCGDHHEAAGHYADVKARGGPIFGEISNCFRTAKPWLDSVRF